VAQKDWAKREWTNLRRIKLEELLNQVHECEVDAERRRNRALSAEVVEETGSAQRLLSLGILYFPELAKETEAYLHGPKDADAPFRFNPNLR
jgi:hypothetical protein